MSFFITYTFLLLRVGFFVLLFFGSTINYSSHSQVSKKNIIGNWIMIKTDMADGSKLIPFYKNYVKHFNLSITKKNIDFDYYPVQNTKISSYRYKLKGNKIIISKYLSYIIEKYSQDSLVINEKVENTPVEKRKRFYLIRKEKIIKQKEKKYSGFTEIKADPLYTPTFNGNIELLLNTLLKGHRENLKLNGTIDILVKQQKVDAWVTYRDKVDTFREPVIVEMLDQSFFLWDLKGFEIYDKVKIDFVLNMEKTKNYRGIRFTFLTKSLEQQNGLYGKPLEVINKSNTEFKLAIKAYKKNKFEKAIKHFSNSVKIDHTLLDAYYNRAMIYYYLGKFNKACQDWKRLNDLEQTEGKKLLK